MASFIGDMAVSVQADNHLPGGFWDGTKFRHYYGASPTAQGGMNDGPPLCLFRDKCSGHGGGKGERPHLGCGLEKRPLCPRFARTERDAQRLAAGNFISQSFLQAEVDPCDQSEKVRGMAKSVS